MKWKDYITSFVQAYRIEAEGLSEREKAFFGEHIEEQCLSLPCRVEVFEFDSPYRLILLFMLDTEPDLKTTFRKENWANLSTLVEQLARKHELPMGHLLKMLKHFRNVRTEQLNFAVDGFNHVLAVVFPYDIQSRVPPLLKDMEHPTPKDIGELTFNLNYCQAADRY